MLDQQTNQPGYRKSQWVKQPPRRICWGTRENLKDPQGISASTEKQRALQLQTTPGNNPLKEKNIIQVESNCISNSTGENCCWRKRSLQQHSAWGTTLPTTLLEEQPQQRSEERRYHQTRNMNQCLTCWESCHPRESTEIFLSILSTLRIFTLFKTTILKNLTCLKTMIFYQLKHAKHLLN
jgi:hypothetical protein